MIKLRLDNNPPPPYNLQIIGGLTPHSFQKIVTCQLWCPRLEITKYQTNWCLNALVKSLWCPGAPQYHKFPLRPQMFQFSGCGVQVDSNIIIKMRHDKTWIYTNKRIRSPGTCVPLGLCKTNSFAKFAQAEC